MSTILPHRGGGHYPGVQRPALIISVVRKEFRRGDDPQRNQFRRWTTDEIQRLTEWIAKIGASHCPGCSTPLDRITGGQYARVRNSAPQRKKGKMRAADSARISAGMKARWAK